MVLGEVARAMLIAHGRITYGGHLEPIGYTAFLVRECELYGSRNQPFIGCVPFSVHSHLTTQEIRSQRDAVGLIGHYLYLNADGEVLTNPESRAPQTDLDRDTIVRSLTGLREYITGHTDGRLVVGGKRTGYQGRIPGVIEETILSIRAGKPIFVAGGFGGVAADAAAILGLDPDDWLRLPDRSTEPHLRELADAAADAGWDPTSNGLTIEQNHQLAISYRASEIASLIVTGLINAGTAKD